MPTFGAVPATASTVPATSSVAVLRLDRTSDYDRQDGRGGDE
jgi:hypothetical protein